GSSGIPEQEWPGDIVAVAAAVLLGVGRRHAVAGVIKDQAGQKMMEGRAGSGSGSVGPLFREGGLDPVEEGAIEQAWYDGRGIEEQRQQRPIISSIPAVTAQQEASLRRAAFS
ncbi:MAG TPA: hypothetical protein VHE81_09720, partial [Lacipirellulaceae bacterium]|nr:hypothetical protein [Lacipirellulaceae bacterium]